MRRPRPQPRLGRRGSPQFRLRVGFVVIALVLSFFAARLVQLQGFDPNAYAARAAAEGLVQVVLPASRGDIVDRNGKPLADSVAGEMIVADPTLTKKHAPAIARLLVQKLGLDYFATLKKLRVKHSRFQYIARRIPATAADAAMTTLDDHGFGGLYTRNDPVRDYPGDDIAANLVGFMGTDGPLGGLELSFDHTLSGTDGSTSYDVGDGNRIPLGENSVVPAQNGTTLHTTIDQTLQWYTQRVLRQAVLGAHADSGTAVVLDSRTGEILALADDPTFDADDPAASPKADRGSRAVSDVYEPGSVEKVLTFSSLIDAGKVTDRTKEVVPSELDRDGTVIHDYFPHGTLHLTTAGVLAKSSNIGTVLAADHFTPPQLRAYLLKFGLGAPTDVGIPGESNGVIPSGALLTKETKDRMAFGQGMSVNALQMAAAVNTIANGGVRIDPSLIEGQATTDSGQVVGSDVSTSHRVVSQNAAHQTMLMMERVIVPGLGVAPEAAVPGYRVAGKTGTAQRAVDGRYDGTYTVSFAGFAPADKPRFTVCVVVQNPRNGGGGGSVGGPAFSKIMSYALHRYGVPPTNTRPSQLPVTW